MITIEQKQLVYDVDFLMACRDGDLDAFSALYERHAPTVLRYAWSQLGDRSFAEEVLQETFTTAWAKRRSATIVDLSLLPWLLSICRNHARNQIRRSIRSRAVSLDEASGLTTDVVFGDEWIGAALGTLSPSDRRVCELCLIEGLSYKQAAEIVNLTPAAVGKRLQRARAQLRTYLETSD